MPRGLQLQPVSRCCKVDGCTSKLDEQYASKHRVCFDHRNADKVMVEGKEVKWCQGCTKFLDLQKHSSGRGRCPACLLAAKKNRIAKKRQLKQEDSDSEEQQLAHDDSGTETDDEVQQHKKRKTNTGTGRGRGRRTAATTINNNNQEDGIAKDTRNAHSPSPCLPSSPLSCHTQAHAPQLPDAHVTSGSSPALPLIPSQILPFHSPSSHHHHTRAPLSCDTAVPTAPNQAQLGSTAYLDWCSPLPQDSAHYNADVQPPFAGANVPGSCDNRPLYAPSPYDLTLLPTSHYPSPCQHDHTAGEPSAMLQQHHPEMPGCSTSIHTGYTVCGAFHPAGSSALRGDHPAQPWRGHTSHHTATDGAWLPSQHGDSLDMGWDDFSVTQSDGLGDSIFDDLDDFLSEPSSVCDFGLPGGDIRPLAAMSAWFPVRV